MPVGVDGGVDTVQFDNTYCLARSYHIKIESPILGCLREETLRKL